MKTAELFLRFVELIVQIVSRSSPTAHVSEITPFDTLQTLLSPSRISSKVRFRGFKAEMLGCLWGVETFSFCRTSFYSLQSSIRLRQNGRSKKATGQICRQGREKKPRPSFSNYYSLTQEEATVQFSLTLSKNKMKIKSVW